MSQKNKVEGFIIFNKLTGQKLATLPLSIPIGETIKAYQREGLEVGWSWLEGGRE